MRYTITEQLLLFFADCADLKRRFTRPSLIGAIAGDPRLRRQRSRMQRLLRDRRQRQKLSQAIYNLKRRGYLLEQVFGSSRGFVLSPLAELKIFPLQMQEKKTRRRLPAGQWLMVFFDIPEDRRKTRDTFRHGLQSMGFEMLQRSVWITPYRVGQELTKLIRLLDIGKYAKPLLVQEYKQNE